MIPSDTQHVLYCCLHRPFFLCFLSRDIIERVGDVMLVFGFMHLPDAVAVSMFSILAEQSSSGTPSWSCHVSEQVCLM